MKPILLAVLGTALAACLWLMLTMPGLWDSHEMFQAYRAYVRAKTPETEAAIALAKKHDRQNILKFEVFMLCVVGTLSFAIYKVRKSPEV